MSELTTRPVFICKRCGNRFAVSHLSTEFSDPDGAALYKFLGNLKKIGYCNECLKSRKYYSDQGRIEDFEAGRP